MCVAQNQNQPNESSRSLAVRTTATQATRHREIGFVHRRENVLLRTKNVFENRTKDQQPYRRPSIHDISLCVAHAGGLGTREVGGHW